MLAQSLRTCQPLRAAVRSGRAQTVRVMAFQDQPKAGQPNIKAGEKLPLEKTIQVMNKGSKAPEDKKLSDIFSGKKAVLFGLPGAYTSVCSGKQMPEYKSKSEELKKAGVEFIACTAVNDAFVMQAWAENLGVDGSIMMLADGDASLHKELGLTQTLPGLGERSLRYSMFIDDGVVKILNVEEPGGMNYKISGPSHMLEDLKLLEQQQGQPIFHEASTFKK